MILAIIQARTGSTRLPRKIFLDYCGKPNLLHVYNRVNKSGMIDCLVIATTTNEGDDAVFEFCEKENINCFRGSENDVLDRFYYCAKQYNLTDDDMIVRVTADCPLIDPFLIDEVIHYLQDNGYDYVSNAIEPTYPDGLDVEVFLFSALKKSWEAAELISEREHVTPYIRNHKEFFKIGSYKNNIDLSYYRWTLDEEEDYQLINEIYTNLYDSENMFTTKELLAFLNENPELNEINNKYTRNEGYLKSLINDKEVESVN